MDVGAWMCLHPIFFYRPFFLKTKKPPGALRQVVPFSHTDYCHDKYIVEVERLKRGLPQRF